MRVCTTAVESRCESQEPSWLQAVQRKPGGWLVVLVLGAYIAADKANLCSWQSLTWAKSPASWGALDVGAKGDWQQAPKEKQAWLHSENTSAHFRKLEILQEDAAGSSPAPVQELQLGLRQLGLSPTSSSEAEDKPHDAFLFLIVGMIIGTGVTFLASFPLFHGIQQSVALFVIGGLIAIFLEGSWTRWKEHAGKGARSFDMWMQIDPHLILFTLLPALLTGDAMSLDTQVAKRVASQCIYLASAGVLCNTTLAALFLYVYLPYDWSFLQCLTTGAILCATDPVAVVALLKELGASPTLTVQIQGESLLNDGTAMVLYAISYSMLQGEKYDASEITIYLLQKVALAVVVGLVVGYVFVQWIRNINGLRNKHADMIQISLTICCAYWSFILSEGVLKINGVLATVFAALMLAHQMWPAVINKESMHTVWHTLEYIGNTVIFFLAGALTGKASIFVRWIDYFHVVVIWIILMFIRGLVLYMSRPVLKWLNEDRQSVTPAEAIVITWGGLRGALGLSLAIQVSIDRAGGGISEQDAGRALFYVGGVAALTLIINATTCPMIVKKLGITRLEEEKRRMLLLMHRRLVELSAMGSQPPAVVHAIERMLGSTLASINKDRRQRAIDHAKEKFMLTRQKSVNLVTNFVDVTGSHSTHVGDSSTTSGFSVTRSRGADVGVGKPLERLTERMSQEVSGSVWPAAWRNERFPFGVTSLEAMGPICSDEPHLPSDNSRLPSHQAWGDSPAAAQPPQPPGTPRAWGDPSAGSEDPWSLALPHSMVVPDEGGMSRQVSGGSRSDPSSHGHGRCSGCSEALLDYVKVEEPAMQPMSDLLDEYAEVKMKFNMIPQESLKMMGNIIDMPVLDMEEDHPLISMMTTGCLNEALLRAMNEGFFACLRSTYYKLMESGDMRPGSDEADVLLNSISLALHASYKDLLDFSFVSPFVVKKYRMLQDTQDNFDDTEKMQSVLPQWARTGSSKKKQKRKTFVLRLVESMPFHILMITAIIINAGFMFIEEEYRTSDNDSNQGWLIAEITFCVIFLIECTLKMAAARLRFFLDLWNNFDLLLVILGIVGVVFSIVALNLPVDSAQGRVVRVARVFRVMRLIRLFRLVRLMRGLQAIFTQQQEALEAQEHIKKIQVLTFFVKAHCHVQKEYVKYFGIRGTVDTPEVARVILQSQVSVFKAISMAVGEEHVLNDVLLEQVNVVRETKVLAEELEKFVMDAYNGGVVSHREADNLLEPVRDHVKACYEEIQSPIFIFTRSMKKTIRGSKEAVEKAIHPSSRRSSVWSILSGTFGMGSSTSRGSGGPLVSKVDSKQKGGIRPEVWKEEGDDWSPQVHRHGSDSSTGPLVGHNISKASLAVPGARLGSVKPSSSTASSSRETMIQGASSLNSVDTLRVSQHDGGLEPITPLTIP